MHEHGEAVYICRFGHLALHQELSRHVPAANAPSSPKLQFKMQTSASCSNHMALHYMSPLTCKMKPSQQPCMLHDFQYGIGMLKRQSQAATQSAFRTHDCRRTHAAVPKVLVETWVELFSITRLRPKSASLHVYPRLS